MHRFTALLLALVFTAAACTPADETPAPPQALPAATPAPAAVPTSQPTASTPTAQAALPVITVYKTPTCGCCKMWNAHLEQAGFTVKSVDLPHLNEVKAEYGIPPALQSCHTGVVDGYVIEGHVPAEDIKRLLAEQPEAAGLTVPGMPVGSPGMEVPGQPAQPYDVLLVSNGQTSVYASH